MTALRHPNIVLFMAASSRPPCLCIVMEYMALGSLFDVVFHLFFLTLIRPDCADYITAVT